MKSVRERARNRLIPLGDTEWFKRLRWSLILVGGASGAFTVLALWLIFRDVFR